jgi:hypothetical protein
LISTDLNFDHFLKQEKDGFSFIESLVHSLMERLSNSRTGLILRAIKNGELLPDRIILTEPDSTRYYYYSLENEYQRILLQEDKIFITEKYLLESGITIPNDYVEEISHSHISNEYISQQKNNIRILKIKMDGGKPIYCTPYTIEHVIRISRENVRQFLSSSQILTLVSKLMGTMNSEVQQQIGHTDMVFWNKLCSMLLEHREDVLMKRKNFPMEIYHHISLLYAYTRNGLDETERVHQENQAKKDEMIRVCKALFDRSDPFLDQVELNKEMEPGLKKWQDFKELFFDKCVKLKNKTGLPLIVNIGTGYIHRDHLYVVFQNQLNDTSRELKEFYRLEMEKLLTSGFRGEVNVFSTQSTFQNSIIDMINKNKPLLSALLKKPKLVSEAVLLYGKKGLKVQSPDQIRQLLDKYYEENSTVRFKRLDHLLELYLMHIYQDAYEKLSVWRRFIMRIFGKHESYLSIFSGAGFGNGDRRKTTRQAQGTYRASAVYLQKEDIRSTGLADGSAKPSYKSSSRKPRKSLNTSKNYSNRQVNRAWEEFEQAMHKKDV